MLKRGPKEKEKILRRLTEKEIKEQLYGFKLRSAPYMPIPDKEPQDKIKEQPPSAPAEQPKPKASEPKQPKQSIISAIKDIIPVKAIIWIIVTIVSLAIIAMFIGFAAKAASKGRAAKSNISVKKKNLGPIDKAKKGSNKTRSAAKKI